MAEVVDWFEYFTRIQTECPWSLAAYQRGLIDIQPWRDYKIPLGSYQARVYTFKTITARQLKKICNRWDNLDHECEWLWSHPTYRRYSTPIPVMIQQNRQQLAQIRQSLSRKSREKPPNQ